MLPADYVVQRWDDVEGPPGLLTAEWWKDRRPQVTVELSRVPLSLKQQRESKHAQFATCTLNTASGVAEMVLLRSGLGYVNGAPTVPYVVTVEWPSVNGTRPRYVGTSTTVAARDQQIRIAQTIRWSAP